jgi:DNA ligase-1
MRREFLQLAETLKVEKHRIGGFYISTKLDGTRCFSDGGITRGMRTEDVPWAGIIDPKTGDRKKKIKPYSTGLWSRYGSPIMAPDWFLDRLPACFLDGELFAGEGNFQLCRSICSGDTPDPRFNKIRYAVYSAPSFSSLFQSGEIKNSNMHCTIDEDACLKFINRQVNRLDLEFQFCKAENFQQELLFMNGVLDTQSDTCYMLKQEKLPLDLGQAHIRVAEYLGYVLEQKGEGIVLRDPDSVWTPKRHKGLLKHKPFRDDEGTIIGFTGGRETDKGSRLLGKIGAIVVDYHGHKVKIAGLTDEEREFATAGDAEFAASNPDCVMPVEIRAKHFKVGETITFQYMTITDAGLPREPRYLRKRDVE